MIIRLIVLAIVLFVLLNIVSYLKRQSPETRKALLWKYGIYILAAVAILLVATGRLHWIGAAVATAAALFKSYGGIILRVLPAVKWFQQQAFANSVLKTRFLKLVINVSNGQLQGDVLSGRYQGATLDSLNEEQLKELLQDYQQHDLPSARLIAAYMQRRFQDGSQWSDNQQNQNASSETMDRAQALQILGLDSNANEQDIVTAHRKLMQKVHPDRGGTDYLAAKINQAKDVLLKGAT